MGGSLGSKAYISSLVAVFSTQGMSVTTSKSFVPSGLFGSRWKNFVADEMLQRLPITSSSRTSYDLLIGSLFGGLSGSASLCTSMLHNLDRLSTSS